jgi:hypothetical protein
MGGDVRVTVSERGRARTEAQSRDDEVGPGSSRRKPSWRSMTPALTGPLCAERLRASPGKRGHFYFALTLLPRRHEPEQAYVGAL